MYSILWDAEDAVAGVRNRRLISIIFQLQQACVNDGAAGTSGKRV
jgi:hypothetical protein